VDEYVVALLGVLDEAIPFLGVEPLHGTALHVSLLYFVEKRTCEK
jgi:hypothetical protein